MNYKIPVAKIGINKNTMLCIINPVKFISPEDVRVLYELQSNLVEKSEGCKINIKFFHNILLYRSVLVTKMKQ